MIKTRMVFTIIFFQERRLIVKSQYDWQERITLTVKKRYENKVSIITNTS